MASGTPTRGGGGAGGAGGTGGGDGGCDGGGGGGGGGGWDYAIHPQQQASSKYQNLEVGSSAGDIGPVMALESPVRPNQTIRAQGLSLNLFLTNQSVEDSSIDVPSSYMGDDSTVSSWPTSPRAGLDQPACCRHLTLRTYLGVSLLLGFIFFVWACAIGFVWGAFLGLIAQGLYLYYIFRLVKRPQPPPDPKTAKRQNVLHFAVLGLSYAVLLYLLIRLCCARNNYVGAGFPSRCYPNAFGTTPPACVRVNGESPPGPHAHGLSAPLVYTPELASVGRLVERWARKQFQTKVKATGKGGSFYHMVAVTGFFGFVDDLAVELACVDLAGEGAAPGNGTVVVRIQSEQRMGTLDGGVNKKRVASLISYIDRNAGGLPAGTCSEMNAN